MALRTGLVAKRRSTRQALVQDRTQRPDIGGRPDVFRATGLFGRPVRRRAEYLAGLKHLYGLKELQSVWLEGTKTTPEGVNEPRNALPGAQISKR